MSCIHVRYFICCGLFIDGKSSYPCATREWEPLLHMDGKEIAKVEDISVGVGALLGIYFILQIKWADNVKKINLYAVQGWCQIK